MTPKEIEDQERQREGEIRAQQIQRNAPIAELYTLFTEYQLNVSWDCSRGSDLHGVTEQFMEITSSKISVMKFDYQYEITPYEIKQQLPKGVLQGFKLIGEVNQAFKEKDGEKALEFVGEIEKIFNRFRKVRGLRTKAELMVRLKK